MKPHENKCVELIAHKRNRLHFARDLSEDNALTDNRNPRQVQINPPSRLGLN